jgi:sugar transferase (PEP-CTERM/EpsH1 system associated)
MSARREAPLVAHVIHQLGTGGLENGLVNIVNRTPPERYRHAIVCLTDAAAFATRIEQPGVRILELRRSAGHSFALYARLWRVLRGLRPALIHSRNLAALEAQIPALLVPGARRVHGEHGRDLFDLHGQNRRYNLLRRAIRPLVQRYIAVSRDLAGWLQETVGVPRARIRQIYNGVDQRLFRPHAGPRPDLAPPGFLPPEPLVIGTVGRLAGVKDQSTLVRAFALLVRERPELARRLRLVIVGDGPDREAIARSLVQEGVDRLTWLAGERDDVPRLMRLFDLFALPSLGEGISNTLLEAMASGLPSVATRVGGNPELVTEGENGFLVPPGDARAMARALARYCDRPALLRTQGVAGRRRAETTFNWERCVEQYLGVYDELLGR